MNSPKLKFTFDKSNGGHRSQTQSIVELESGDLATGSRDSTIKVFDMNQGNLKYTFDESNGGHRSSVPFLVELENGFLGKLFLDILLR